jgi:uncharacterized protein YhaN
LKLYYGAVTAYGGGIFLADDEDEARAEVESESDALLDCVDLEVDVYELKSESQAPARDLDEEPWGRDKYEADALPKGVNTSRAILAYLQDKNREIELHNKRMAAMGDLFEWAQKNLEKPHEG